MKKEILTLLVFSCLQVTYAQEGKNYKLITNPNGIILGYNPASGVKILTVDGLKFKDLNKNGKLDKYEDWRLSADLRAKDLAQQMTIAQISGLMLYSGHQMLPGADAGFGAATYSGMAFSKSKAKAEDLSDNQKKFLKEDNLRHILITKVQSPEVAAAWNNNMQAFVEGIGLGIPGNTSTDPRHTATINSEFNAGAGGTISMWPDGLGMAATFDPAIVKEFGHIAAREYRALGISTALSPQIDLGTEPRWYRIAMTFGESPLLAADMARAYIDGFQTSSGKDEIKDGWGYQSVNAMVKHWPGGGAEEGGRDGHWAYGKFTVYPGKNFEQHLSPFINGAFKLDGKTKEAAAVMPYYTITSGQDPSGQNVANGYSKYMITDLLRKKYNYDGVVCTDWLITGNEGATPDIFAGKPWGAEALTINERHYKVIMAGVDQFGGNNEIKPIMAAYQMGIKEYGAKFMRARFETSAIRLLKNIFRVGLFENPYLDPQESKQIVGNTEFMKAGFQAQLKSVVLLKNKSSILPVAKNKTVFVPRIYYPASKDWWGNLSAPKFDYPVDINLIKKYYNVTEDPAQADFSIVFVSSPYSAVGGYDLKDRKAGGNGYVPITLQYNAYTASTARVQSMAAGDPVIDPSISNRSYINKTVTAYNTMDLRTILDTKAAMKDKPVIVVVNASKPMIFNEFEQQVEGIVLHFGVSGQAVMDIISGAAEPSGLLPVQMPANMLTVEQQYEDVPFDMTCHTDAQGHVYDFGYGMNWKGQISDERNAKYHSK
ncbi:glycoside hydrolase family 3 protein [Pedobacter cryoconitis]|uniref:glycoside hydrolase family 3 protein n=1 Tax=Pedobacter cryoconitis TaxID=188932 RepID=UPI001616FE7E|nr:glycoside hydrolase family 3 N-terminal domain-containing protein [Pedobacter cryoconitis]MBB5644968.1 beta-glucosidase [Pedobacter cryoconitis]